MNSKPDVQQEAVGILDRMGEIVRSEMVARVGYVSQEVYDESRTGSLCGDRRYCVVGALWVAGGAKVRRRFGGGGCGCGWVELPGAQPLGRRSYLRNRPALALAFDALNATAEAYISRHDVLTDAECDAPIEALFEGGSFTADGDSTTPHGRRELLRIIAAAKRRTAKMEHRTGETVA